MLYWTPVLNVVFIHGLIGPFADRIASAREALAYQPATTFQATARAVVEYTGRLGYEKVLREVFARTPVHLVAVERSRGGWHVPAWTLAAASGHTVIPGAGHMMALEALEAFGGALAGIVGR
jgi:lipase